MTKISIILPVYNVSSYLDRCFESIISQTLSDFEVIVINDGSTDDSGEICNKWATTDSRISVYHIENGGVARARNLGIEKSDGEYLYFVDPDDWIEANLLEDNFRLAAQNDCDLVLFGFFKEQNINGKISITKIPPPKMTMKNKEEVQQKLVDFLKRTNGFSVWTKLIKKQFVTDNNITFPLLKRGQDMAFSLELYRNANRISVNDGCYYHYNAFSAVTKFDPNTFENHLFLYRNLFNLFDNWMESDASLRYAVKVFIMWFGYVVPANIIASVDLPKKEKLKQLKAMLDNSEIKGYVRKFKSVQGLSMQAKIFLFIFGIGSAGLLYSTVSMARAINTSSKYNFKKLF